MRSGPALIVMVPETDMRGVFAVSVTAKIALNFSQTKWLVRPVEHGGPHTIFFVRSAIAELPPRERQCVGRFRTHSFWFLAAAVSTKKNILAILYQKRRSDESPLVVSSTLAYSNYSRGIQILCLLPHFIFLQLISSITQRLRRT